MRSVIVAGSDKEERMLYRCPECSKIIDGYIEKCPECGRRIEMTDSISAAEARNIETAEEGEAKFELFKKRIRNGYITIVLLSIAFVVASILVIIVFDLPINLFVALEPVMVIVFSVIIVVICLKCRFFCCPHCDNMLKSHNALRSMYCPNCGKRIRKEY